LKSRKKILFASHDPGGANILYHIIKIFRNNKNYKIELALLGPAKKLIKISGWNIKRIRLHKKKTPGFPNKISI